MQNPRENWDSIGLGIPVAVSVCYWIGLLFMWLADTHPLAAGLVLILIGFFGWFLGFRKGRKALRKAEAVRREADKKADEARTLASAALEKAKKDQGDAESVKQRASMTLKAAESNLLLNDANAIEIAEGLALEQKIEAVLRAGSIQTKRRRHTTPVELQLSTEEPHNGETPRGSAMPCFLLLKSRVDFVAIPQKILMEKAADVICTACRPQRFTLTTSFLEFMAE